MKSIHLLIGVILINIILMAFLVKINFGQKNKTSKSDVENIIALQNLETKNLEHNSTAYPSREKKYLLAYTYWEQLSMATNNLMSLASLATATERLLVEPFVNNSRFSGLPKGAQPGNLSSYFDIDKLQRQMAERGYTQMASFTEFIENCKNIGTVIIFLHKNTMEIKNIQEMYKISKKRIDEINNQKFGTMECDFIKHSTLHRFLGNKTVTKYLCVDAEVMVDTKQFKKMVLGESKCSVIISWKGNGTSRTHFKLAETITTQIKPHHIRHSNKLIDIAHDFIRTIIKQQFISVHVRVEHHVRFRGIPFTLDCIRKLITMINKRKLGHNLTKIFLAHDMDTHGSDLLTTKGRLKYNIGNLLPLEKELTSGLMNPIRFDPVKYGLYDRGQVSIVDLHILSLGESLFTIGNGNFQEWIKQVFLKQNSNNKTLIYSVCDRKYSQHI